MVDVEERHLLPFLTEHKAYRLDELHDFHEKSKIEQFDVFDVGEAETIALPYGARHELGT